MKHKRKSETKQPTRTPKAVLTLDVVKSREMVDIPTKIHDRIQEINRRYRAQLFAPFVVTLGDEFQGVLEDIGIAFQIFLDVQRTLPIYAGVGIGEVEKGLETSASHMTGEAFVRSRAALNSAKKRKRTFVVSIRDDYFDTTINALAFAAQFIRLKQTKRQKAVIDTFILEPDLAKWQLAHKLRVSGPAISKILKAGGFYALEEIQVTIRLLLSQVLGV
jgi:hypothetical protein